MNPSIPGAVKRRVPSFRARNADGLLAWRARTPAAASRSDRADDCVVEGGPGSVLFISVHELLVGGVGGGFEGDAEGLEEVAEDGAVAAQVDRQREQCPLR